MARIRGELLILLAAACGGGDSPRFTSGEMVVSSPAAWRTTADGPLTIGFRLANGGASDEVLLGVRLATGEPLALHTTGPGGMAALERVAIPAGEEIQFGLGGPHVMTEGVPVAAAPGDTLSVVLEFAGTGDLAVPVPLFRFSEARDHLRR